MGKVRLFSSSLSVSVKASLENRRATGSGLNSNLLLAFLGLLSLSSALVLVSAGKLYKDAYQQLVEFGFPTGLLPDTVTDYTLADDGHFAVYLQDKCNVYIPGEFPVVYSKTITGILSYASLKDLKGIQVKAYYFWWSINAITVTNGNLLFEVGLLTAKYPVKNFDESPSCGKKLMIDSILADE